MDKDYGMAETLLVGSEQCVTRVGELIEVLKELPPDTKIWTEEGILGRVYKFTREPTNEVCLYMEFWD